MEPAQPDTSKFGVYYCSYMDVVPAAALQQMNVKKHTPAMIFHKYSLFVLGLLPQISDCCFNCRFG